LCPKPTNFVVRGWSGIEGIPDFASAIRRPPLVTQTGIRQNNRGKRTLASRPPGQIYEFAA